MVIQIGAVNVYKPHVVHIHNVNPSRQLYNSLTTTQFLLGSPNSILSLVGLRFCDKAQENLEYSLSLGIILRKYPARFERILAQCLDVWELMHCFPSPHVLEKVHDIDMNISNHLKTEI